MMMFRPGVSPRTQAQEAVRAAARLLVLTRQIRLALERTNSPGERSSLLSTGLIELRETVDLNLRDRWSSVSPPVLRALERVDMRLQDLKSFTNVSNDSFHLVRLVRAEVLGLMGRKSEALHELERHAVFLSIQSRELRADVASRYFDLCTANDRFADGTRVLLDFVATAPRIWAHLPGMQRQLTMILRRKDDIRRMGMVRWLWAFRLWSWLVFRLRPASFRTLAGRVFSVLSVPRILLRRAKRSRGAPPRAIRAMGGIGDLLMMTPGLCALAQKRGQKVQFAVPSRFAPLFKCNERIETHVLEDMIDDWSIEGSVIDLTDCPAARGESAVAPNVRTGRIELFATAMGINRKHLIRFGPRPFYEPSPDEWLAAEVWLRERDLSGGQFVAVQAEPAEAYRRYDRMPEVACALAEKHPVVVLHNSAATGYEAANVYCAFALPLGVSLAIACRAMLIISADSALVHLAGARDVPCIAIYGPTDGKLATQFFPRAVVVDQRSDFACMPCWRNETMPCFVTGGMRSACLDTIPVERVLEAALSAIKDIAGKSRERHRAARLHDELAK